MWDSDDSNLFEDITDVLPEGKSRAGCLIILVVFIVVALILYYT